MAAKILKKRETLKHLKCDAMERCWELNKDQMTNKEILKRIEETRNIR